MFSKAIVAAVALGALLVSGVAPSHAKTLSEDSSTVSGIIVQYSKGIEAIAKNGQPTGANLLRSPLSTQDLGAGLYVLHFENPVQKSVVNSWVKRMVLDRRIDWAEPNHELQPAGLSVQSVNVPVLQKARAASAPRSPRAKVSVTSSAPSTARVRLTWSAPANRYGARIVGYQIQYSINAGVSWRTLIRDTGSRDTRVFINDGIRAGVNYRFRIRAITNDGSGTDTVGLASTAVSALVRTTPKPVVITSGTRIGPGTVNYLAQSLSDRGGFPLSQVRYRAIATATDLDSQESSLCNETRCRFPRLLPDVEYKVEVFATNPRGSSNSNDGARVNDFYFPLQWYLNGQYGVSMPSSWLYAKGSVDRVVAVIDTGIKPHEQLDKKLTRNADGSIYGYDFVSDINSAGDGDGPDPNPNDEGGDAAGGNSFHGTHVAGIIAAEHDFLGTAGVSPGVKILPIRALGRDGGTTSDLISAIRWAAGIKVDGVPDNRFPVSVINLSLGAKDPVACDGAFQNVFRDVVSRGITIVAAAGNEGRGSLSFPANCPGVIAVVASQSLGDRASYSNYGEGATIAAPGGEFSVGSTESPESRGGIISAWVDQSDLPTYRLSEGTSMAAPVVSGIVALLYSMQPTIKPKRVRTILVNSASPFALGSNCVVIGGCGAGIVNAHHALARASKLR